METNYSIAKVMLPMIMAGVVIDAEPYRNLEDQLALMSAYEAATVISANQYENAYSVPYSDSDIIVRPFFDAAPPSLAHYLKQLDDELSDSELLDANAVLRAAGIDMVNVKSKIDQAKQILGKVPERYSVVVANLPDFAAVNIVVRDRVTLDEVMRLNQDLADTVSAKGAAKPGVLNILFGRVAV